jgi:5-methylcytosine-specific restriction endonuclease McrA
MGHISGTLKYEVLKRAQFHCELGGVSADIQALEVDHIIPRKHGGTDDLENLQALCYSCNAMKRDRRSAQTLAKRKSSNSKARHPSPIDTDIAFHHCLAYHPARAALSCNQFGSSSQLHR